MKFNLKQPCKDCPFIRTGTMFQSLSPGRMEGIVHSITEKGQTFPCHKTINYGERDTLNEQHCAGALLYVERLNETKGYQTNQMLRIAERLGLYDHSILNMDYPDIIKEDDLNWDLLDEDDNSDEDDNKE